MRENNFVHVVMNASEEGLSGHSAPRDGQARRFGTSYRDHKTATLCPLSLLIAYSEVTR